MSLSFDYISDLTAWVLYFEAPIHSKEVWIEYKTANNTTITQTLPLESSWKYVEILDKGIYESFVPYFVTQWNAKIYANNRTYIPFQESLWIQNVGEGVEVNDVISEYYFYWKRERLMTAYSWTVGHLLRRIQGRFAKTPEWALNKLLLGLETKIGNVSTESKKTLLKTLIVSIKYELEKRDTQVQLDEIEATADLLLIYWEVGFDLTGFPSIWWWLGSVTTYWVGYINDDPYLEEIAKQNLQNDLIAVAQEINPSKKFKKLMNIGGSVKNINKARVIIKQSWLDHVLERHTPWGSLSSWKSIFKNSNEIENLINKSTNVSPTLQTGWNYQRIATADKMIWTDVTTWQETSIYTVITNSRWELVTAFPWKP